MSRLVPRVPDELDPEQRELYETIVGGPRAQGPQHFALVRPDGSLEGPFNALLLSPALGHAVQELGAAIRYRTPTLTPRLRELAILVVAAHWDSAFERRAHEAVGRASGLTDQEVADVRAGRVPDLADPVERAGIHVTRELVRGAAPGRERETVLGERRLLELSTLVGYYALLALQLRVFDVE